MSEPATPPDAERVLNESVHAGGTNKPFREVTTEEVRARATELREVTGWGPTAKVGSVAMAWSMLAKQMETSGAEKVGDLDPAWSPRRRSGCGWCRRAAACL